MPTIEDITKILQSMDSESYNAAVRFIYYLEDENKRKLKEDINNQEKFINETAGKVNLDFDSVVDLRMRSMI